MRILVTGGAGFIGRHLVEKLLTEPGVTVVRAADRARCAPDMAQNSKLDFRCGDLRDAIFRDAALEGIDVVLHQAALPSVPRSINAPLPTHLDGVDLTFRMLESARLSGVKRFVYASSSSVYGDADAPVRHEELPLRPRSPYAATKAAGELYLRAYAQSFEMDTLSLRYFNVFGPRQPPDSPYSAVIARFARAYLSNQPIDVHGDGLQSRDFTFVENAVQANLLAARATERLGGRAVNVACGESWTVKQLLEMLYELTGNRPAVRFGPLRAGDVAHSKADLTLAHTLLKYAPQVRFKEGLARTVEWYRAHP